MKKFVTSKLDLNLQNKVLKLLHFEQSYKVVQI